MQLARPDTPFLALGQFTDNSPCDVELSPMYFAAVVRVEIWVHLQQADNVVGVNFTIDMVGGYTYQCFLLTFQG